MTSTGSKGQNGYKTVGKSQLKKAIKSSHGTGVMEAFNNLKIEEAKVIIRETSLNFTEIFQKLQEGYRHESL